MTVKVYLGERYEHTHENQAFDHLYHLVQDFWGTKGQYVTLIGNVTCNGHELDAVLIKPDSITVIDFKNFGGMVEFNENGPWYADGEEVKGGSKINPFKQIHANKFALLNWIKTKLPKLAEENNLGHISGLVLFQQSIYFDRGKIPVNIASWFNVGDFSNGFTWLTHLASPNIRLSQNQQQQIVAALNVLAYDVPDGKVKTIQLSESIKYDKPSIQLTSDQKQALCLTEELLNSDTKKVLLLTGMASTGKTTLIQKINEIVKEEEYQLVALAPNANLANILHNATDIEFSSIYGYIYNKSAKQEDSSTDLIIRPLRKSEDCFKAIYLIDEAQQLSDSYFEFETERFGTGYTFSDFLSFSGLCDIPEKRLIILGDPYQVERGQSLLNLQFYTDKNLICIYKELSQIIKPIDVDPILDTAIQLVEAIKSQIFNRLDIKPQTPELVVIPDTTNERLPYYKNVFQEPDGSAIFLTFSNERVNQVIDWGRSKFLSRAEKLPEPNDRVELRNKINLKKDNGLDVERFFPGRTAIVLSCSPTVIERSIPLKGRKSEIILRFREMEVLFSDTSVKHKLYYLPDYLLAEKPELDKDSLLALRIFAEKNIEPFVEDEQHRVNELKSKYEEDKSAQLKEELRQARADLNEKKREFLEQDPYWNAARFRYAYASTVHHAQGCRWDDVLIDASYNGQGRDNEGYFRWLYTAITCAHRNVWLDKFIPIDPLDKLVFKTHRVEVTDKVNSLFQLPYDKAKQRSDQELARLRPDGLTNHQSELINLWLYVAEHLEIHGLSIVSIKQSPYQEQYTIANMQGEQAVIILSYNSTWDITRVCAKESSALVAQAMDALKEPLDFPDPLAQQVLQTIYDLLKSTELIVEGGKSHSWQLVLTLTNIEQQYATLKVYYEKSGSISTLEVEKVTHKNILDQLQSVFKPNKESR